MSHAISGLYPLLRIELPGIPEPVLVEGVAQTVQDFLTKSEAWKHTTATLLDWTTALPFPALAAPTELPAGTRLHRIDIVKYAVDGISLRTLTFKTRQQLDGIMSNWEVDTSTTPRYWTLDGPDNPRIVPAATEDKLGSLLVRSVVTAAEGLSTLPDKLMHEFEDVIRAGVLARLMKIPGKDWTNLKLAASNASLYKAGWIKARSSAQSDFGHVARETSYGGI